MARDVAPGRRVLVEILVLHALLPAAAAAGGWLLYLATQPSLGLGARTACWLGAAACVATVVGCVLADRPRVPDEPDEEGGAGGARSL